MEYTIQAINKIFSHKWKIPFELILVDNASTDGTQQWVQRVKENTDYYMDIIYIRLLENVWDRYGMREWLKHATGEYIVQVDNDIDTPEWWIEDMLYVLENTDYKIVMLKRKWVNLFLEPKTNEETWELTIGKIERPVACYMCHRDIFYKVDWSLPWNGSKLHLANIAWGMVCKILNVFCKEIEWWDWTTYIQHEKYERKRLKQFV